MVWPASVCAIVLETVSAELGAGELALGDGVAAIGVIAAIALAALGIVELGSEWNEPTGDRVDHAGACEMADNHLDLDRGAVAIEALQAQRSRPRLGPVDGIGQRRQADLVPESAEPPKLAIGCERHAVRGGGRPILRLRSLWALWQSSSEPDLTA